MLKRRIAEGGKLRIFPRHVSMIRQRLIEDHPASGPKALFDIEKWPSKGIGYKQASTRLFACAAHDREIFRPIEESGRGEQHPLDATVLKEEHHFLLAYRIHMMHMEDLISIERARSVMGPSLGRNQRVAVLQRAHFAEQGREMERVKSSLDDCYLRGDYTSLLDTPVDLRVWLPIRIATAGRFCIDDGRHRNRDVYLTIYPIEPIRPDDDTHEHRVIVTRLRSEIDHTGATVGGVARLARGVDGSDAGASEFLTEFLGQMRNAFFSIDYELRLPEQTRISIEQRVHSEVLAFLRWLDQYCRA